MLSPGNEVIYTILGELAPTPQTGGYLEKNWPQTLRPGDKFAKALLGGGADQFTYSW